jgi:phage major head subunit gpT-like protein
MLASMVSDMADAAANHPDELIFELIKQGFNKNVMTATFFSPNHVVTVGTEDKIVSNVQIPVDEADEKPLWILLDTTRPINPFIWQERVPYEFQQLTDEDKALSFMTDEFFTAFVVAEIWDMDSGKWLLPARKI